MELRQAGKDEAQDMQSAQTANTGAMFSKS